MNIRTLVCIAACLLTTLTVSAEKVWSDVTNRYIQNPQFTGNNKEGWLWESNASTQEVRVECISFYNGNYDLHQQLRGLLKGHYRLSVQGFYRMSDNSVAFAAHQGGTESITASLYAGGAEKKLASLYSASLNYNAANRCYENGGKYYPDGKEAALAAFDEGFYWNEIEFDAEGDVMIGVRCSDYQSTNYTVLDNFKLEYYGELVKVSDITLSAPQTQLFVGEQVQMSATITPANATVTSVKWSSNNTKVAVVSSDGVVTAKSKGNVIISATATDGSGKQGKLMLLVTDNEAEPGSLVINEVMASNVDQFLSPAFNFDGWIELYNPTDRPVSLVGLRVSDPTNGEGPWTMPLSMGIVPAKGFRTVWFDSNGIASQNAPFKLDTDGGSILLTNSDGEEIAREVYPASYERTSYARTTDGGDTWGVTNTPTPGETNAGIKVFTRQLAAPVVNQPSQLFNGALSVSVDIPAGAILRYTIDSSLPTEESNRSRDGQFRINENTCLRLRLFANDALPSPVTTRSYIVRDQDYYLPVVSVVSDWDFLYSTEFGVMAKGPNGRPGNGQSDKCNWNMDWERPVNFSYIDANGEMVLNQDVNLEMCGGWSRAWEPHSFKLKGSKEMGGDKNLPYPFFEQKPYIRNRTLQIRNGGNDNTCRFKDPSLQYIIESSGLNIDCQGYQPVHEFINGEYIGVLNVREPNNKHYVYANYGWDEEEIDQFEISPDSNYVQKCGTADAYEDLLALSANAADPVTYNEIRTHLLDIDAYINYMAIELYLGNNDWPKNNIKGFRHRDDGKFRFVVFDLDHSFNSNSSFSDFFGKEVWTFDQLYPSGNRIRETITFVTLFKNLLKNDDFRRQFIDAYCLIGGSVLEKTRSAAIIDKLLKRVEPAMNMEGYWSWNGFVPNSASSTANEVKSKLNNRLTTAINAMKGYTALKLQNTSAQRATLKSNVNGARIFVNGQMVPTGAFDGQLFPPVKFSAEAPAGYKFSGWYDRMAKLVTSEPEVDMPKGVVYFEAHFDPLSESEKLAQGVTPVCINEVSGSNDSYIDEYGKKGDWVELFNTTDQEIDVEGMYLTDNLDKPTKYQISKENTKANTKIAPHGYLIVWCDKRATTDNGLHASFKIDGDGGQMSLMAADKSWKNTITYGAHDARTTIARFPDGAPSVYTTNVTTICKPNLMTSYMAQVDQTTVGIEHNTLISSANGFRLRYGNQQLLLRGEDNGTASVDIYSADGQLVEQATVNLQNGTARINVSHLPAGFYIARATSEDHTRVSCKFMK